MRGQRPLLHAPLNVVSVGEPFIVSKRMPAILVPVVAFVRRWRAADVLLLRHFQRQPNPLS
jgi:hypothetical protein